MKLCFTFVFLSIFLYMSALDNEQQTRIICFKDAVECITKNNHQNDKKFQTLVKLCKGNHDFLISHWELITKGEKTFDMQNILLSAIFYGCDNVSYMEFLKKIFQSSLAPEIKLSAMERNLQYISVNYKDRTVSDLLKHAITIARDDDQKNKYYYILSGKMFFDDIQIMIEGSWNDLKGLERGKQTIIKDYIPEKYFWLSQDENLELIYIALFYQKLINFIRSSKDVYHIDVHNMDYKVSTCEEIHNFINRNSGHTPVDFNEKEKHLRQFLKLSMFANDCLLHVYNEKHITKEELDIIHDLFMVTQWDMISHESKK